MAGSIDRKIAALMAKAESSTHPEESHAFMAKAEALMLKHAVDRARVEKAEKDRNGETTKELEQTVFSFKYTQVGERFMALGRRGSSVVVDAIGLTGIAIANGSREIFLYGHKADIDRTRVILEAVWRQAERHLKVWRRTNAEYKMATQMSSGKLYYSLLNSYVYGFAKGAAAKIREEKEKFIATETGSELVLVNRMEAIQEFMADKTHAARRSTMNLHSQAQADGFMAGKTASLAQELTS